MANKLKVRCPYQTRLYGIITQIFFTVLSVWNVDHCTYYNSCARVQLIVQYAHHRALHIYSIVSGILHDYVILHSTEANNKPHFSTTGGITLYVNVKSLAAMDLWTNSGRIRV